MLPEFSAPWPLGSPHLQTLGAALPVFIAPPPDARVEPLRIPLPEGGALHAEGWWHPGRRRTALLVHGVGGSMASQYVVRAAKAFFAAGYSVVRLNLRGAGDSLPDAPTLYHAALTADFRAAVDALVPREEVESIAVVGFSLGGNATLRFAAEESAGTPRIRAAVAISPPTDLATVSRLMERPLNLPYRAYILQGLVRQGWTFARMHPERAPYAQRDLLRVRTIWAYDDVVVAPMHGFGTAANYYAHASSGPALSQIQVPTLFVHAEDDPLVPGQTVQPWLESRSKAVELAWSSKGGHVGWFSGLGEAAWLRTWAMEHALAFLDRV